MGRRRYRREAWLWAMVVGLGAGAAHGCQGSTFACTSDQQCIDGSVSGICQPTGWCSFEDPECASMQRYAEHSGAGLGSTCVPELEEGTASEAEATGDVTTGEAGPVSTEAGDDPPLDGTTETGATSLPLETGEVEGSSSSEPSTTGEPWACEVVLFDDFEDASIGPQWDPWADGGTALDETESALWFSIVGEVLAGDDAGVLSVDWFDLREGYVRLEITELPTPNTEMQLYWQLDAQICIVQGLVQEGQVYAFDQIADIGDARWLQMRFESGLGYLERSVDGVAWELMIEPVRLDCDLLKAQIYVFGGAGMPSAMEGVAAVGTVEACGAPSP